MKKQEIKLTYPHDYGLTEYERSFIYTHAVQNMDKDDILKEYENHSAKKRMGAEIHVDFAFENLNALKKLHGVRVKNIWREIKNDYTEEDGAYPGQRLTKIDAWKTSDDNEDGKVIATVDERCRVVYLDERAKFDKGAQEIIKETITAIKQRQRELVIEVMDKIQGGENTNLEILLETCTNFDLEIFLLKS